MTENQEERPYKPLKGMPRILRRLHPKEVEHNLLMGPEYPLFAYPSGLHPHDNDSLLMDINKPSFMRDAARYRPTASDIEKHTDKAKIWNETQEGTAMQFIINDWKNFHDCKTNPNLYTYDISAMKAMAEWARNRK